MLNVVNFWHILYIVHVAECRFTSYANCKSCFMMDNFSFVGNCVRCFFICHVILVFDVAFQDSVINQTNDFDNNTYIIAGSNEHKEIWKSRLREVSVFRIRCLYMLGVIVLLISCNSCSLDQLFEAGQ